MERANPTPLNRILAQCFAALRSNRFNDEAWLIEDRADRELVSFTQKTMRDKLDAARLKGRRGWWKQNECSMENLENSLHSAIAKGDMADVINYAAMIQVRRITDE